MLLAIIGIVFCATSGAQQLPRLDGRIVGGSVVTIQQRPYQLSLQRNRAHICGASILSETRALTAAHCTFGTTASGYMVRAGSTYRNSGGQMYWIRKILQHPRYDSNNNDYDVSVLVFSTEVAFGASVRAVSLPTIGSEVPVASAGIVSGWGALSEGGSSSNALMQVILYRVSDDACRNAYGYSKITARMVCFGYTSGGRDSCQGDSGGPLTYNDVQVGVVSWGYGCARPQYPGIYAKVANREIRDHIDAS